MPAVLQQKSTLLGVLALTLSMGLPGCRTPSRVAQAPVTETSIAATDPVAKSDPLSAVADQVQPIQFVETEVAAERVATESTSESPEPVPLPSPDPAEVATQSVDHFLGIALSSHPRIRSARARVSAASSRVPQARALDDPLLSNTFWPISDQSLQTAAGRAGNTMSLSQKYPWPEKRRARASVACREVQIAVAQLSQAELEIIEAVRLAYYDLWFATRAISITADNRQIASELISLAEARNAAGGSQQDVLRAQLQLDLLDDRLVALRQQKALAQADLAALISQPELPEIEPQQELHIGQVPDRLDWLFAAAEKSNPRLQEKLWTMSRDRQKQRLACLSRYPDFVFGTGWTTVSESDAVSPVANGHDAVNFAVGLTLPIWHTKTNASIREASSNVVASSREFDDSRNDTFRTIRRLSEQALAAEEQVQLYQQRILPRAKRTLQLSTADYRGQLVGFGEVVDNFTELLMFELQTARAKATVVGRLAQIERAVGSEVVSESP